jgi:hypothetical protein
MPEKKQTFHQTYLDIDTVIKYQNYLLLKYICAREKNLNLKELCKKYLH